MFFIKKIKFFIPVFLFVGLVLVFAIGLDRDPGEVPSVFIDKPAPSFNLPKLLAPKEQLKNTDMLGQVSLLNIWGSWCVGCAQEHELLMMIAREGVVPIYGINWKDDRSDAISWLNRFGNPYKSVGVDRNNYTGIDYGVYGAPETFIIDSVGFIRYKHIGPLTRDIWFDEFVPLIESLKAEI
ncbi:MAG: DsbE family thiol:disulfide interchange protein [Pseudomonadota bacterium]|nr:DsbE family thiol:disulfide interchange protein [Pseudomonadota bacterium]